MVGDSERRFVSRSNCQAGRVLRTHKSILSSAVQNIGSINHSHAEMHKIVQHGYNQIQTHTEPTYQLGQSPFEVDLPCQSTSESYVRSWLVMLLNA